MPKMKPVGNRTNHKRTYARFCMCEICGNLFWVRGKRALIAKYCSKKCANIGQPLNRKVWNKGLTVETDERVKRSIEASTKTMRKQYANGQRQSSMKGKHHTEESIRKIRENNNGWQNTEKQVRSLDKGRDYFRGLTKETCPAIKRRAEILSKKYKGKKNPEHSKRMKEFYQKHPERHPNFICAQKGHITSIEKAIREELEKRNIAFIFQHPLNGFFLDFAIIRGNLKIDVECDGEYYHRNKERDHKRDSKVKDLGWKIIRLEEKDILNSPQSCMDKIEQILRR